MIWPFRKKQPQPAKYCHCGHIECSHYEYSKVCNVYRCACVRFIERPSTQPEKESQ